jgi:hypothetical protein
MKDQNGDELRQGHKSIESDPIDAIDACQERWFIKIGNVFYASEKQFDNIGFYSFLAPMVFWLFASIVLHFLGTKRILDPWWIYPTLVAPAFTTILISAIAQYLQPQLFGDYYDVKLRWLEGGKTAYHFYQEALTSGDDRRLKKMVIYEILREIAMILLGWVASMSVFWILVY